MATSTQTQGNGALQLAVGRYLSADTAAAFNITCGFKPRWVQVLNNTSNDEYQWSTGMADASAFKRIAAGTGSSITTLGITPLNYGFTVGLDLDVNVISEQLSWQAIG